ncbi:Glutamyl/glutaminyl-tRNA synthetase, class Ic, catalytic domain protein [Coriobacterium glomerans PW2]|uniref:Glutamyl/glutaminyl-tRNA synthetase, class Ic, catalytic domain protein n=1 Tax=Coriobacterium glomerans (strain ATCC 49209 / DSM 20642 / JCM 10262 / PW2) TaxID=700015 RepID=F2N7C0_CORGP|nr:tRNA glutamyl-Q(34) synthetase GluQRS [Coriobacterium glomerans]AEB06595.1 Glutamyl/glutaminyl-tRNA synthetase, class Ic, catalytic domain protein [Coriobacterium glomerans PW2]
MCAAPGAACGSGPSVGRFAPSPSGRMHAGNIYTALVCWLSQRSAGGSVVLRIEDLDERTRSGPWVDLLLDDLRWLGLTWDIGPLCQRDRLDRYAAALERLDRMGLVYPCFCTRAELHSVSAPHGPSDMPIYPGTCRFMSKADIARASAIRSPARRLKVPDAGDPAGRIDIRDRVYGSRTEVLARDCGDFVVQRSDGVIAYQLAVCVDDAEMGVTEVVRGRDLLGSVAPQRYLQNLLGFKRVSYAHVPLLVAPGGRRLSKRDRDLNMGELRARFASPERLLGWLAHLTGLAPDATPVSAERLAETFSWSLVRAHRRDIEVSAADLG